MLENIEGLIKTVSSQFIGQNSEVPEDKKEQTIQATTEGIGEGLKNNFNLSNLSGLTSLLGGNSSVSNSNPIISSVINTVVSKLVQKVGLSQGIANTIATSVVPMVINSLTGKIKDPNEKGFDLNSIIGAFTGNKSSNKTSNESESLVDTIGKIFG